MVSPVIKWVCFSVFVVQTKFVSPQFLAAPAQLTRLISCLACVAGGLVREKRLDRANNKTASYAGYFLLDCVVSRRRRNFDMSQDEISTLKPQTTTELAVKH